MFKTHRQNLDSTFLPKIVAFAALLIFQVQNVEFYAQANDPFGIQLLSKLETPHKRNLLDFDKTTRILQSDDMPIHVKINEDELQKILKQFTPVLKMSVPISAHNEMAYHFIEYNFYAEDFSVNLIDDFTSKSIPVDRGIHLKGLPVDGSAGFSNLSLFANEIYGSFVQESGAYYSLTPLSMNRDKSLMCVISDEKAIDWTTLSTGCHADDIRDYLGSEPALDFRSTDQCKRVDISVNVDYDLFLKFNKNPQAVVNYVTGLFNNVHTLYKNEGISIGLAQINIHTTEDKFSHISASSDLENFRKKYPNTQKHVKLLLSGYSKNSTAPLGGIAYINTICNSAYSYAYGNVVGNYSEGPAYSWDVFVVTHELGHVFGSRHTHACAWGPQKNQAIDNCAKLEGTCAQPGIPKKGTMMSYCYQKNMPGIDFLEGFGTEPGALIRASIQNASCLKSSAPEGKSLDTSHTVITANAECSDGMYTHYYFDNNTIDVNDDILLLSVRKDSTNLGSIRDSGIFIQLTTTAEYGSKNGTQITAGYVEKSQSFHVINKFWTIKSKTPLQKPLFIQYILTAKDITDLTGSAPTFQTQDLMCIQIQKPASADPKTNHALATSALVKWFPASNFPGPDKFLVTKQADGNYLIELQTTTMENTGFGILQKSNSPFVTYSNTKATSQINATTVEFQTSSEINCKRFVIEKSVNGQVFDSIGNVVSKGSISQLTSYTMNLNIEVPQNEQLRIKAISSSGQILYSPLFQSTPLVNPEETLKLYPNPVTQGKLTFEYQHKSNTPEKISVSILDVYGKTLRGYSYFAYPGNNSYNIYTYGLKNGLHYLRITSSSVSLKTSFTVGY